VSYYPRVAIFSLATLVLTLLLVALGPRGAPLTLAAQTPVGEEVPAGSPLRVTFSRPVDRQSAEASFRLEPPSAGRFFWEEQTLTFQPTRPLSAETRYRASFGPGLMDAEGRRTATELAWEFQTRGARLLVVRSNAEGGSELWLVAPDGAGARLLVTAADGIAEVAVAPDGARAVYTELRGVSRSALMLVDLASGETRALVDDEGASASAPAWSALGDFIAFERRAVSAGGLGVPRVWLAQPDGTLLGSLIGGDGSDSSYAPAWSPDGNQVAFVDGISQAVKVYSFFSDEVRELPATSGERPAWMPDGSALVVSSAEVGPEGPELRLRLVTLGEAPATRALSDGAAAELSPSVDVNGTTVAFVRRGEGPEARIWLVSAARGRTRTSSPPGRPTGGCWPLCAAAPPGRGKARRS
jgi:dipeptidyl aminopeptidase/acylaminoacyl peptidase